MITRTTVMLFAKDMHGPKRQILAKSIAIQLHDLIAIHSDYNSLHSKSDNSTCATHISLKKKLQQEKNETWKGLVSTLNIYYWFSVVNVCISSVILK